eukprot:403366808
MTWPREKITEGIMNQLKTLGFFALTNVQNYNETELFEASQWFYSLSEEDKKTLNQRHHNPLNSNNYRGLAPFIANDISHKELFDMGLNYSRVSDYEKQFSLHEETPFPQGNGEKGEWFKQFMHDHYDNMHQLGIQLMSHIAEGFGKPLDYFDKWFVNDTCSTMRLIHYLPRSANIVKQSELTAEDLKLTTPPHADGGFLTLLSTFNYPGLQVMNSSGLFKSIEPQSNIIVVNIGKMLSRITNGTLKATYHQVLDIGIDRYSSPFFFEPMYTAAIPMTLKEGTISDEDEDTVVYGDWCIDNMRQYGEWKHFEKTKPSVKAIKQKIDFDN